MSHITGIVLISLSALVACTPPEKLADYRPVVDPATIKPAKFNRDLDACRLIALKLQADYEKRQQRELGRNLLIGVIAGAVTGAIVGNNTGYQNNYIAAGAASGAVAGMTNQEYGTDIVKYGPRRVVDRCMTMRGYAVLNDLGRG